MIYRPPDPDKTKPDAPVEVPGFGSKRTQILRQSPRACQGCGIPVSQAQHRCCPSCREWDIAIGGIQSAARALEAMR